MAGGYWGYDAEGGYMPLGGQMGHFRGTGNYGAYSGDTFYSPDGSTFIPIDDKGMAKTSQSSGAPPPAPTNPASTFNYRPSNNYSQYYTPSSSGGGYGRNPLRPFIPSMNQTSQGGGMPQGGGSPLTASALIASMGRASPVAGLGWNWGGGAPATGSPASPASPVAMACGGRVRGYQQGGTIDDLLKLKTLMGMPPKGAMMAQGGPVRGQGGGQDDSVMTRSRPKNFILPADVVADLGDGSSAEGHKRLIDTWRKLGVTVAPAMAKGGGVPVALSQDEHEVPLEAVTALGGGSNEKGASMLHHLIKKVRAHKATKGFPPQARSPLTYMGKR